MCIISAAAAAPGGRPRLTRQLRNRAVVAARSHAGVGEDAVVGDPAEGLVEHLPRVGLEHDALAGAPAARVHLGVPTHGELALVVVGIAVWPQVDVALRALQ